MSLVQPGTLAEYLDEEDVTSEMVAAIERAEAIAASQIGCSELRSRTVQETINIADAQEQHFSALSGQKVIAFPQVFLSDGPARSVTSMTLRFGDQSIDLTDTARISGTGWAVRYRLPFNLGFRVDLPYDESEIDITYVAGWHHEADLPAGIRQFIIAQSTQVYATPIGGVIKVRLGDNYVDLNPEAIRKQVEQYAEMLDQWRRVRL
jgi:hypothetical protein